MMEFTLSYYWFALCFALMLFEVLGANGIGLFFGAIAACVVGALIEANILAQEAIAIQWALWFFITVFVAMLLYKPMKKWRTNPKSEDVFSNIVGTTAKVAAGGLMLGKPGKVYWSGTMMNAAIIEGSKQEAFFEGDMVQVADVRGNQLLVESINKEIIGG